MSVNRSSFTTSLGLGLLFVSLCTAPNASAQAQTPEPIVCTNRRGAATLVFGSTCPRGQTKSATLADAGDIATLQAGLDRIEGMLDDGTPGSGGARGPAGPQGERGVAGPQGPAGAAGAQGAKGDKGDRGDQGIPGIQGLPGPAGAQGPAGPQGERGVAGPAGAAGAQGAKGDRGDQGIPGIQGLPGPAGAQGPAGPQGPAGLLSSFYAPAAGASQNCFTLDLSACWQAYKGCTLKVTSVRVREPGSDPQAIHIWPIEFRAHHMPSDPTNQTYLVSTLERATAESQFRAGRNGEDNKDLAHLSANNTVVRIQNHREGCGAEYTPPAQADWRVATSRYTNPFVYTVRSRVWGYPTGTSLWTSVAVGIN